MTMVARAEFSAGVDDGGATASAAADAHAMHRLAALVLILATTPAIAARPAGGDDSGRFRGRDASVVRRGGGRLRCGGRVGREDLRSRQGFGRGGRVGNRGSSGQRRRSFDPRRAPAMPLRWQPPDRWTRFTAALSARPGVDDNLGRSVQEGTAVRDEQQDADGSDTRCGGDERAPCRAASPDETARAWRSSGHTASERRRGPRAAVSRALAAGASRVTGVNGVAGTRRVAHLRASVQPCSSDCASSFARTCALVSTISFGMGTARRQLAVMRFPYFQDQRFRRVVALCSPSAREFRAGITGARPADSA